MRFIEALALNHICVLNRNSRSEAATHLLIDYWRQEELHLEEVFDLQM